MNSYSKVKTFIFALILSICFSGCNFSDDEAPEPVPVAFLSIYHGSPSIPSVDIYIDNAKANTQPFLYTTFSGYNSFHTGNRNLKFTPFNAANNLVDTTVNLVQDKVYSLFITNEANNFKPFMTEDVWTEPALDKAMIRIIHISPDAPALDLFIGDSNESIFNNQNFRTASTFKEIAKGTHKFTIKTSGEEDIVTTLADVEIREKRIYTLIVRGLVNTPEGNSNIIGMQLVTNHTIIN